MITTRPATAADVQRVHPDQKCSWRAWAVELDGLLAGVIGVALSRPYPCLFCWFDERLRPHFRCLTVLRLIKRVEAVLRSASGPVLAIRDPHEPRAPHILKRLGFRFYCLADGDAVYIKERR